MQDLKDWGLSSTDFSGTSTGTGSDVEQRGHKPGPTWGTGVAGHSFTCYATVLASRIFFYSNDVGTKNATEKNPLQIFVWLLGVSCTFIRLKCLV